jgi:hypothetical protein
VNAHQYPHYCFVGLGRCELIRSPRRGDGLFHIRGISGLQITQLSATDRD